MISNQPKYDCMEVDFDATDPLNTFFQQCSEVYSKPENTSSEMFVSGFESIVAGRQPLYNYSLNEVLEVIGCEATKAKGVDIPGIETDVTGAAGQHNYGLNGVLEVIECDATVAKGVDIPGIETVVTGGELEHVQSLKEEVEMRWTAAIGHDAECQKFEKLNESDQEAMELVAELLSEEDRRQSSGLNDPTTVGAPTLPLFDSNQPQQQQPQQQPQQQLPPPWLNMESKRRRNYSVASSNDDSTSSCYSLLQRQQQQPQQPLSPTREAEIADMADYIKEVIERGSNSSSTDTSSKLKVHEVILIILLNSTYGSKSVDLRRILAFCDENGREISASEHCRHFKTLDTETMGLLWQKIKGNRKASYDTFARAMRVRREKSEGYFDYLDTGKRSKKRIYRFGPRTIADLHRMKQKLRLVSEPKACGF